MRLSSTLLATLTWSASVLGQYSLPQYYGKTNHYHAAFCSLDTYNNQTALFTTSFGMFDGAVSFVENVGKRLDDFSSVSLTPLAKLNWPNEIKSLPESMFGPNVYVVCGGFLVPTHTTGQVTILDMSSGTPKTYEISTPEKDFFFHDAYARDVDGDGLLDLVTAKAKAPGTLTKPGGKLVWLKNPGTMDARWKENFLLDGPDIFFRIADLNKDGVEEIVASQFFTSTLSLFYRPTNGPFGETSSWEKVVIDTTIGEVFDVRIADLNLDGKDDLLVTNHVNTKEAGVFAYEAPSDFRTGVFTKHILHQGFVTLQPGVGQASPGGAQPFIASPSVAHLKPQIAVSGDGSQQAYIMSPLSQSQFDWNYNLTMILDVKNTVGAIAVGDTNNDGYAELFVPNYDDGQIHLFSFKN